MPGIETTTGQGEAQQTRRSAIAFGAEGRVVHAERLVHEGKYGVDKGHGIIVQTHYGRKWKKTQTK